MADELRIVFEEVAEEFTAMLDGVKVGNLEIYRDEEDRCEIRRKGSPIPGFIGSGIPVALDHAFRRHGIISSEGSGMGDRCPGTGDRKERNG